MLVLQNFIVSFSADLYADQPTHPLPAALVNMFILISQGKLQSKQILVLGLDGAGKTSVLHSLATNHVKRSTAPTEGINAVCINTEEAKMEFLESKCVHFNKYHKENSHYT